MSGTFEQTSDDAAIETDDRIALLGGMFQAMPHHVAVLDGSGILLFTNPAWDDFARAAGDDGLRRFGVGCDYFASCREKNRPCAAAGKHIHDGACSVLDGAAPLFAAELPCSCTGRLRRYDVHAAPLTGFEKTLLLTRTERPEESNSRNDCRREVDHFFDIAVDAMCVIDAAGEIARANSAFLRLVGRDADEALGRDCRAVLGVTDCEADCPLARIFGGEERVERDVVLRNGNAETPCLLTAVPVRGSDSRLRGIVAHFTDISGHVAIEDDLRVARDSAEKAHLAKSRFLAMVSHEVRTPVTTVIGMADMLAETELDERQRRFVDMLRRSSRSLLDLSGDLLDFSRMERGMFELDPVVFRLPEMLSDTVDEMRYRAEAKGLFLELQTDPDLPIRVRGDGRRLRQVFINLVGNAVKFTDAGGVTVSAEPAPREEGDDAGTAVLFTVRDTGIGIPEEMQPYVFDSFVQADVSVARFYGGSGLGLAICKQLVELMGGRIRLESTPGAGTMFTFVVPFDIPPD